MKKSLLLLICAGASAFGDCFPITGDRILGRDLALADPHFAGLPAALTLGFVPAPGMKRVFTAAELARVAKANGIALAADPQESCFANPLRKLTQEEATHAMVRALPASSTVTIVEISGGDIPVGDVEFPLAGIEPAVVGGIQTWRGDVRFTATRKVTVWARVKILQSFEAVVPGRDLEPNTPIDADSLHVTSWSGPLLREKVAVRPEDAIGRVVRKTVKAGSLIPLSLLDQAPAVRRGESVRVEVNSGFAHLTFHVIAEKDLREGDPVDLRNPVNGRLFRARLQGTRAVVNVDAGGGL